MLHSVVEIEFDPAKDRANVAKHRLSLSRAAEFEILTVEEDLRRVYGEPRFRAFGLLDGTPHCLAFTRRGANLRAISLRRAHLEEFDTHVTEP
ncbi:MAG TPA: BrnT family toxin [Caulobacteraceae bacterium]